jgi:hypothetical protein
MGLKGIVASAAIGLIRPGRRLTGSRSRTRTPAATRVAPVYGWFTEGFDTLNLKEAMALLDELAS